MTEKDDESRKNDQEKKKNKKTKNGSKLLNGMATAYIPSTSFADPFKGLRHPLCQYQDSGSRIRETIFQTKSTISEVLRLWLAMDQLQIPSVDDIIESNDVVHQGEFFVRLRF